MAIEIIIGSGVRIPLSFPDGLLIGYTELCGADLTNKSTPSIPLQFRPMSDKSRIVVVVIEIPPEEVHAL